MACEILLHSLPDQFAGLELKLAFQRLDVNDSLICTFGPEIRYKIFFFLFRCWDCLIPTSGQPVLVSRLFSCHYQCYFHVIGTCSHLEQDIAYLNSFRKGKNNFLGSFP